MKTILSYILTSLLYFHYSFLILVFHVIQVVTLNLFGDKARRKAIDLFNRLLVYGLYLIGCSIKFKGFDKVPANKPVIIVSNHQSLLDIAAIGFGFKKLYPKFISKIELGKGIPSVSYNLKHGKSALIDRKNGPQSVREIFKLGKLIEENNYGVCIFPEGTRSKTGKVKKFMTAGINTLLRAAPSAVIVPFVINGHYEIIKDGMFPFNIGKKVTYTVLDPIDPKGQDQDEMLKKIQVLIQDELNSHKNQLFIPS